MKIDRLMAILTYLLRQDKTTAGELAARFEVSRRTILRDLETLSMAGIPICTLPGIGGGISLMPGYKLDKSVLTAEELQSIFAGIKSLHSVSPGSDFEHLLEKLAPGRDAVVSMTEPIVIDLSSHYRISLSEKIGLLKQAIREKRRVMFDYYYEKGTSRRIIEPYFIAFKWTAWYLFGWCTERQDFRLFKLNRLWELKLMESVFQTRPIPPEKAVLDGALHDELCMQVRFDPSVRYLLIETYGLHCFEETAQGLEMNIEYTNRDYLFRWVLGFGSYAEVLGPPEVRQAFVEEVQKLTHCYFNGDMLLSPSLDYTEHTSETKKERTP